MPAEYIPIKKQLENIKKYLSVENPDKVSKVDRFSGTIMLGFFLITLIQAYKTVPSEQALKYLSVLEPILFVIFMIIGIFGTIHSAKTTMPPPLGQNSRQDETDNTTENNR